VRWHHPTRGPVEPSIFIPIAEKTSSIIPIGAWILRKSCQQVAIWNAELGDVEPLELSVNLSPREFKQKSLIDVVDQTLKDTGFPPALLHFELTEGALFDDIASARDTLHGLKGLGVGLDLDDFGTGYSSLKYLRELPFDSLKIDRYFIASLDPLKAQSRELVRAIVNMAKVLGLEIIAEGIETEAHRTTLRVLGCRFGQGFFFSKPLQPEAMHHHLAIERSAESAVAEKLSLPLSSAVLAEEHA
jgi:EAL domain-containing protein (putative c-di-GMP-specific phosphodiesterase class I)